jgi:hypothetical protein
MTYRHLTEVMKGLLINPIFVGARPQILIEKKDKLNLSLRDYNYQPVWGLTVRKNLTSLVRLKVREISVDVKGCMRASRIAHGRLY